MEFELFSIWKGLGLIGFSFLSFDFDREDQMSFSLIGFSYDSEDKVLEIDFLWRCYEFNFKPAIS